MKDASLVVNELKVKVDLTKFTERHVFSFDDALDESVGNDEVYRSTVQPLVATIFKNGKATCFAYGQTGSGKTFTMQPLPMRAARDMFALLEDPQFADLSLFVSCFEIYGGKLYDLLNGRKRLDMREDGKKRVCIVDLKVCAVFACCCVHIDQFNKQQPWYFVVFNTLHLLQLAVHRGKRVQVWAMSAGSKAMQ